MARLDMVRSYLEKLAASVWPEAAMDEQGVIFIRHGSAIVGIEATTDAQLVVFGAIVAYDVPATPALFEWLNEQNNVWAQVKVIRRDDNVQATLVVPSDEINEVKLRNAFGVVAAFVDEIDDQLVATLGGQLPPPPPSST